MKKNLIKLTKYFKLFFYLLWLRDIFFIITSKNRKYSLLDYKVNIIKSKRLSDSFFGYYDSSPRLNNNILFYSSKLTWIFPNRFLGVYLNIFDETTNQIVFKRKLTTYNWQQGVRAKWVSDSKIIFNDYVSGSLKSFVYDIYSKELNIYNFPMVDIVENGLISLDFNKLSLFDKSYGYFKSKCSNNGKVILENFNTNDYMNLFDIDDLENFIDREFKPRNGLINHIMVSPDKNKFVFIYRYWVGLERYDEIFCYCMVRNKLEKLKTGNYASHYCWISDNVIFGHISDMNNVKSFYSYNIDSHTLLNHKKLISFKDGHPTCVSHNIVIFDSYPDKSGNQSLYLFNLDNDSLVEIGSLYHSFLFRGVSRCDLHPRYCSEKGTVFIDTCYSGKRQLIELDFLNEKNII